MAKERVRWNFSKYILRIRTQSPTKWFKEKVHTYGRRDNFDQPFSFKVSSVYRNDLLIHKR